MTFKRTTITIQTKDKKTKTINQYRDDKGRFISKEIYQKYVELLSEPTPKGYLMTLKGVQDKKTKKTKYVKRRIGKAKNKELKEKLKIITPPKKQKIPEKKLPRPTKKKVDTQTRSHLQYNFSFYKDGEYKEADADFVTNNYATFGLFSMEEMCRKSGFNPVFGRKASKTSEEDITGSITYETYKVNPLYDKASVFPIKGGKIQKIKYDWANPRHRKKILTLGGLYV